MTFCLVRRPWSFVMSEEFGDLWKRTNNPSRGEPLLRRRTARCTVKDPCRFALVADMDEKSRVSDSPLVFRSYMMGGNLTVDGGYKVAFERRPVEVIGKLNEAGRGMELSELIFYKGKLLTFDDRTGAVFSIPPNASLVIAEHILCEGEGKSSKGMKIEWATIKDGALWIGSFGKEFLNASTQQVVSEANFWIAVLDESGGVERKNWKPLYNAMRELVVGLSCRRAGVMFFSNMNCRKAGAPFPGYLLHEAGMWSPRLRRWVFLPRRVSKDAYEELEDEKRGSNLIILASEDFKTIELRRTGFIVPERGFSSFKFVPGTGDLALIALKTVEDSARELQKTYITVFGTLTGAPLLHDLEVPGDVKYEGIEFLPREQDAWQYLVT